MGKVGIVEKFSRFSAQRQVREYRQDELGVGHVGSFACGVAGPAKSPRASAR